MRDSQAAAGLSDHTWRETVTASTQFMTQTQPCIAVACVVCLLSVPELKHLAMCAHLWPPDLWQRTRLKLAPTASSTLTCACLKAASSADSAAL